MWRQVSLVWCLGRRRVSPQKEFLGCRAGAASGTTAPTPSRPYRAFNVTGVANFAMMDYKHAAPLGQGDRAVEGRQAGAVFIDR